MESTLSGNDAATVAKDTLVGGITGGITGGILAGAAYGIEKGVSAIGNAIKGKTAPTKPESATSVLDGACFVAGTRVLTSLGLKAIESVRPGDKVLAADPETGRQEEKEVTRTFVKETDTLVHLRIGGEEIVTTESHPFYVDGEGWIPAGELTEEDYVLDSEGRKFQVEEKYVEKLEESVKVYNFEVEELHTYYVGYAGILVHNKCWEDGTVKANRETEIHNPVLDNIRTGSGLKSNNKKDKYHAFNDIIDNYVDSATKTIISGKDGVKRSLYQVEGSLNGKDGVFEWIVDPDASKGVTHRLFIEGGKVTGIANKH